MFTRQTDYWKLNMLWIIKGDLEFWTLKHVSTLGSSELIERKQEEVRGIRIKLYQDQSSLAISSWLNSARRPELRDHKETSG